MTFNQALKAYTFNSQTIYFAPSSYIKVFPSSFRGSTYDPESLLNTEFNFTHIPGYSAQKSFIINWEDSENTKSKLTFSINGYYFEITGLPLIQTTTNSVDGAQSTAVETVPKYVAIKLDKVALEESTDTNYTWILSSFRGEQQLDNIIDGTSYFTGIAFSDTELNQVSDSTQYFNLKISDRDVEDNIYIATESYLPTLIKGKGEGSIILKNDTNLNSADGKNSVSVGNGTKAIEDYSIALGSFNSIDNQESPNNTILMVGNGDSDSARSNIFEIFKDSINILGKLNFYGSDLLSPITNTSELVSKLSDNNIPSNLVTSKNSDKLALTKNAENVTSGIGFRPLASIFAILDSDLTQLPENPTVLRSLKLTDAVGKALNVGSTSTPIYFKEGIPTVCSGIQRLTSDKALKLANSDAANSLMTVGSQSNPVYFENGIPTICSDTLDITAKSADNATNAINAQRLINQASQGISAGELKVPVYFESGIPKKCSDKLNVYSKGLADIGGDRSNNTPLNVGNSNKPVYFKNGVPVACDKVTANIADALSTSSIGSNVSPVYFESGIPKPCNNTLKVNITGNANTATRADTAKSASIAGKFDPKDTGENSIAKQFNKIISEEFSFTGNKTFENSVKLKSLCNFYDTIQIAKHDIYNRRLTVNPVGDGAVPTVECNVIITVPDVSITFN